MRFWQLTVKVEGKLVDELTDFLFEIGAISITFADAGDTPIFEPSAHSDVIWESNYVTALFDETTDSESILVTLAQHYPHCLADCQLEQLIEQAWERACLDQFEAMRFGNHLWICPSWATPPDPTAVNIILDPGLAFGTGTHPTTALCLEWLDAHPPLNQTVIDYGSGSGILGIASAKLGARAVWAVDNHEQALISTKENAKRNHISATQLEIVSPADLPQITADLLVANILALPLIELAPTLVTYVKVGGYIVLSGILSEQQQMIIDTYSPFMSIESIKQSEEWVRIVGIRTT